MPPRPASPLPDPREPSDCRCLCGSLLARVIPAGVELKCRRCKRTLLVPLSPPARAGQPPARSVEPVSIREVG